MKLLWSLFLGMAVVLPLTSAFVPSSSCKAVRGHVLISPPETTSAATPRSRTTSSSPFSQQQQPQYQSSSASSRIILFTASDPLATEGDWSAFLDDENTGLVYYFNKKTGDSLWEPPTKTFPTVTLRGRDRRRARDKQLEYVKAVQLQEEEKAAAAEEKKRLRRERRRAKKKADQGGEDWFSNMFVEDEISSKPQEIPVETTTTTTTTTEPRKGGFLSGLLEGSGGDDTRDIPVETTEPTKKGGFFAPVEEEEPKKAGFFSSLLDTPVEEPPPSSTTAEPTEPKPVVSAKEEAAEEEARPREDWFGRAVSGIFESSTPIEEPPPTTTTRRAAEPVAAPEEVKEDWFGRAVGGIFAKPEQEEVIQEEVKKPAEIIAPVEEVKPITIDMSAYVLPHPSKVFWGGEDAVFTQGRSFGVFDGVSGAFKLDGVPLYSKTLAKKMKQLVGEDGLDVRQMTKLLTSAAETADKTATGASTAVVASISENGYLRALNLGDSACIVVRNGKVAAKTREISHYFECPYQLSVDSPDRPRDGTKLNMELQRGDLILMASDGVFDNLSDEKVVEVIQTGDDKTARIAKRVADESRKVSLNRQVVTPYSKLARKYGDPDFSDGIGGKVDDISCVVVRYE